MAPVQAQNTPQASQANQYSGTSTTGKGSSKSAQGKKFGTAMEKAEPKSGSKSSGSSGGGYTTASTLSIPSTGPGVGDGWQADGVGQNKPMYYDSTSGSSSGGAAAGGSGVSSTGVGMGANSASAGSGGSGASSTGVRMGAGSASSGSGGSGATSESTSSGEAAYEREKQRGQEILDKTMSGDNFGPPYESGSGSASAPGESSQAGQPANKSATLEEQNEAINTIRSNIDGLANDKGELEIEKLEAIASGKEGADLSEDVKDAAKLIVGNGEYAAALDKGEDGFVDQTITKDSLDYWAQETSKGGQEAKHLDTLKNNWGTLANSDGYVDMERLTDIAIGKENAPQAVQEMAKFYVDNPERFEKLDEANHAGTVDGLVSQGDVRTRATDVSAEGQDASALETIKDNADKLTNESGDFVIEKMEALTSSYNDTEAPELKTAVETVLSDPDLVEQLTGNSEDGTTFSPEDLQDQIDAMKEDSGSDKKDSSDE